MNKTLKNALLILLLICTFLLVAPDLVHAKNQIINDNTVTKLGEFKDIIGSMTNIVIAFALTSSVLIFIIHFISLAKSADNPNKRSEALDNLLKTGIITSILGGIGLFTKLLLAIF